MATPITWQNITAPSFADASRAMALAQQSISGAFDGLKGTLNESQAFDKELWKRQDQEATQDALAKIYQAQNADQMTALNQSGALDQAVAANGARIDRAAVNALRDGRVNTLQQRELQGLKFGEEKLGLEQAGATAEGMAAAQRQDPVAFNAWLAANPQNRKMAEVLGLNRTVQQSVEDQLFQKNQDTRAGNVDARAAEAQPLNLDVLRSNLVTAQTQQQLNRAHASKFLADAAKDREAAAASKSGLAASKTIDAAYKEFIKGSALDGGTLDTEDGKKTLREAVNDLVKNKVLEPKQVDDIYYNINKYFKDGVPVSVDPKTNKPIRLPLPANAIIEAIGQSSDNPLAFGFSRRGDQVAELIAKRFGFNTNASILDDNGGVSTNEKLQQGKDVDLVNLMVKANAIKNQRNERLDAVTNPPIPTEMVNALRALVQNTAGAAPKKQK